MIAIRDDGWSFVNTYASDSDPTVDPLALFVHRVRGTFAVRLLNGDNYVEHETFNEAIESIKRRLSGTDEQQHEQQYTHALFVRSEGEPPAQRFTMQSVAVRLHTDGWWIDRNNRRYAASALYKADPRTPVHFDELNRRHELAIDAVRDTHGEIARLLQTLRHLPIVTLQLR